MKIRTKVLSAIVVALITWRSSAVRAAETVDPLVENGLVLTMNTDGTIIERGTVAISKGVIVAVGPTICRSTRG